MATGVNKMILIGNLGRDPEIRFSQSGMAVCTLSVAVSERRKDGDEWREETEWFRVKTFGRTAENAAEYLAKGRQVYVEGKGRHDKYTDKEGIERRTFEVIADTLKFLSGGNSDSRGNGGGTRESRPAAKDSTPSKPQGDDGFDDESLPF